ncbi:MAG: DUF2442 domain-containing protein [Acidobacteriota bacterium]
MAHRIHRVTSVKVIGPHELRVGFEDGASQEIDFEPVLKGEMYGPLRGPLLFAQVKIDPEVHTLIWPNDADFDPAILHNWPEHKEPMRNLANQWALASV